MLPSSGKIVRNSNLLFKRKYFEKALFVTYQYLLLHVLLRVLMHESIVPGRELVRDRDLHTQENLGSCGWKNILKTYDLFPGLMLHIQAFPEQQSCSNPM